MGYNRINKKEGTQFGPVPSFHLGQRPPLLEGLGGLFLSALLAIISNRENKGDNIK